MMDGFDDNWKAKIALLIVMLVALAGAGGALWAVVQLVKSSGGW